MSATDQHDAQAAAQREGMVVVDDISARLHVRPASAQQGHRYDAAAIAAAMAAVLTRHLEPDLLVQADGTVWCHIEALAEHGFTPDEATGEIPRRAATRWEEIIVEHVDLDYVERAGQRTHVEATALGALPGEMVAVSVNGDWREYVNPERVNPTTDERWEQAYGIGAPAAIRAVAAIAAPSVAAHAGQMYVVRAPVTWPPPHSPWVTATPVRPAQVEPDAVPGAMPVRPAPPSL